MKLKAGKYFPGEWTHHPTDGVGLLLSGKPHSPSGFIETLQDFSCHPVAARRILNDLMQGKDRLVTVMPSLEFEFIGDSLADVGVTMTIVPPSLKSTARSHHQAQLDFAAALVADGHDYDPSKFTAEDIENIEANAEMMKRSLKEYPADPGAFSKDPKAILAAIEKTQQRTQEYLSSRPSY